MHDITYGMLAEEVDPLIAKLSSYDSDCRKALEGLIKAQNFWREAIERKIDIPWAAEKEVPRSYGTSVNLAQYGDEPDPETNAYPLDVEATQVQFARVIRWAKDNDWTIEKQYDDDSFKVIVTETPIGKVEFYSTRQVVCKKVKTGTKMVEAVEAHEEDVYEYKCDKVAFLKIEI